MKPPCIKVIVNEFADYTFDLDDRFKQVTIYAFYFQGSEEAFSYGVVPTVALSGHTLNHSEAAN